MTNSSKTLKNTFKKYKLNNRSLNLQIIGVDIHDDWPFHL